MAIKKQSAAPVPMISSRPGEHALDKLAPLALSAGTIASSGVVRAAFDAVAEHPLTARSYAAARSLGQEELARHTAAAAGLAQRSAEAYARRVAAFVKPTTPPPF